MSNKPLLKHPGTLLFLLLLSLIIELNATTSVRFNNDVRRPNFVLVLTDDLDQTLGGAASLVKTKRLIVKQGVDVTNWFVHTPVCCPSRSQLLTGRMFHNLKVANPTNRGCMHVDVSNSSKFYAQYYFARYFANQNYTVGVFGKHLNNDNPFSRPPVGVDRWLVNGGGNYHNPSFSWASSGVGEPQTVTFDNCTDPDKQQQPQPCYSTSVIGNASLTWIQDHLHNSKNAAKPFFAYISVKAPHIQDGPGFPVAIPAPWYTTTEVANHQAPRTPNYNASCPNHHWLVRQQSPLTEMQAKHVDQLYQSRLRTLLSVDDLVEDLISTLETAGVLHNTYIVFTSDNGYRLGQFRMPQGKFHPYENDIRVPFWMRGPGITASSARSDILGTHIDIMPTLLGLVDYDSKKNNKNYVVPSTMDGENLAPQLLSKPPIHNDLLPRRRNAVLIEYIGLGDVWRYEHLEDSYNNSFRALRVMDGNHTNWKYIEFTDCQQDWNFTKQPQEYELFNLDTDPFEMHNLYSQVPHEWIVQLSKVTRHLYRCRGDTCRNSKNAFVSLFPTAIKQQPKSDIIYNDRTNRSTIG